MPHPLILAALVAAGLNPNVVPDNTPSSLNRTGSRCRTIRLCDQKNFRSRDGIFLQMSHTGVREKLVSDIAGKFVGEPLQLPNPAIRQQGQ